MQRLLLRYMCILPAICEPHCRGGLPHGRGSVQCCKSYFRFILVKQMCVVSQTGIGDIFDLVPDAAKQLMHEQNNIIHYATQHPAAQHDTRQQVCPGFVKPY